LSLIRRIDELYMAWPFLGSRRMAAMLRLEGRLVNRSRVRRLMRRIEIAALGPKPRTSTPARGHEIHPYLLREMLIDRPNQVWSADITYIPIGRGFLYLVAVMDWASRAGLTPAGKAPPCHGAPQEQSFLSPKAVLSPAAPWSPSTAHPITRFRENPQLLAHGSPCCSAALLQRLDRDPAER
jgi:hypothetical protein